MLSATTFRSFVREFSSLEVCARWIRFPLIGQVRKPSEFIRSHSSVRVEVSQPRLDSRSAYRLASGR